MRTKGSLGWVGYALYALLLAACVSCSSCLNPHKPWNEITASQVTASSTFPPCLIIDPLGYPIRGVVQLCDSTFLSNDCELTSSSERIVLFNKDQWYASILPSKPFHPSLVCLTPPYYISKNTLGDTFLVKKDSIEYYFKLRSLNN